MRKTDKSAKLNKPPKAKVEGGGIGTLKQTKEEIAENDYDLSINKYKEIEYIPVEYPPTEEILKDMEELEVEIHKNLVELRKMLEENDD